MRVAARPLAYALILASVLMACNENATSQAQAATAQDPARAAASPARVTLLAKAPGPVTDYHQSVYVDECQAAGGTLTVREPGYVKSADFNGDGRPDYVLDGNNLDCSVGASFVCGNGNCPFDVLVSQGAGFVEGGTTGHAARVVRVEGRDLLEVTARTGDVTIWGWTGNVFDVVPGAAAQAVPRSQAAGFTIDISLTPRAAARLADREGIVVSAIITGRAIPERMDDADEMGEIDLGSDEITVPGRAGPVVITGKNFKPARLALVEGRRANVRVGVFSARRSSPDNLLDCQPFIYGGLDKLSPGTHAVRCSLIGEG